MNNNMQLNLLSSTNSISVPFIKVTFGDLNTGYTFGVYNRTEAKHIDENGFYQTAKINYPNYIKKLSIKKINGQFNQYTLSIVYPIRPGDDPNFFEKVFSSISESRKMYFSYGDCNLPSFIYKDEEAIYITADSDIDIQGSKIYYTVTAVSAATLGTSGAYTFAGSSWSGYRKPSDNIKQLLANKFYGLQDLFIGMNNLDKVEQNQLIPGDDKVVYIESKTNINVLDYLKYLVECMRPVNSITNNKNAFYALKIVDDINTLTNDLGGTYFKIEKFDSKQDHSDAYTIDIGYPTANIVTSFKISNSDNYSIYYKYQKQLNNEEYVERLNAETGEWETLYAPVISSGNKNYRTREVDTTWWSKVTEYPINGTLRIKGLLRPAILMSYVRINTLFFGAEHLSSGLYIITQQVDDVSEAGYYTTLSLTRVGGDK